MVYVNQKKVRVPIKIKRWIRGARRWGLTDEEIVDALLKEKVE